MTFKKFKPVTKIFAPNDKLSKVLFNISAEDFKDFTDGKNFNITEGDKYDKRTRCKLPVKTPVTLQPLNQADRDTPLDMFDRAVLAVCQSAWLAGQRELTANVIYRILTGKNSNDQKPKPKLENEIMASISKLSDLQIKADLTAVNAAYGYNNGSPIVIPLTPILPCHIDSGKFNYTDVEKIIYLDAESPLLTIAQLKKQVLAFRTSLLDTGSRRNNRYAIAAKFYTMTRVFETIRQPKNKFTRELQPVITFEKLFKQCRLTDATKYCRKNIVDSAKEIIFNLEENGVIQKGGFFFN